MRVLHVITGLRAGGAETQLLEIARRTVHDVEVAALHDVGVVGEQLRGIGVPVHDIGTPSSADPRALGRLARLMHRGRFDAVHCHLARATLHGTLAARLAGVPVVVATEHSLGETRVEGRPLTRGVRTLLRTGLAGADAVIAVSQAVRGRLERLGVGAERIRVIPNGIDLDAFAFDASSRAALRSSLGLPTDAPVVGSIGRLAATKGHDRVLHAVASLDPEVRLVLVGDGARRAELERLVTTLGLGPRVSMLGERRDTPALLSSFDVFVAASDPGEETFAVAPLEALASGLPVVVTACPALDGVEDRRVVRSAPDPRRLSTDLATALGAQPDRTTATTPPFLAACAIDRVVAEIDGVYAQVHPTRGWRRRRRTGA